MTTQNEFFEDSNFSKYKNSLPGFIVYQMIKIKRPLTLNEIVNLTLPNITSLRKTDGSIYSGNIRKAVISTLSCTKIFFKYKNSNKEQNFTETKQETNDSNDNYEGKDLNANIFDNDVKQDMISESFDDKNSITSYFFNMQLAKNFFLSQNLSKIKTRKIKFNPDEWKLEVDRTSSTKQVFIVHNNNPPSNNNKYTNNYSNNIVIGSDNRNKSNKTINTLNIMNYKLDNSGNMRSIINNADNNKFINNNNNINIYNTNITNNISDNNNSLAPVSDKLNIAAINTGNKSFCHKNILNKKYLDKFSLLEKLLLSMNSKLDVKFLNNINVEIEVSLALLHLMYISLLSLLLLIITSYL